MRGLAVISLLLAHIGSAQPHDSVRARHLRWAALDQQAVLNLDSALILLRVARRADPGYFPAQVDYLYLRHLRYEHAALRREAMEFTRSADPGARCLGFVMAGVAEYRSAYRALLSLERSGGASTCSAAFLAMEPPRADYPDSARRAYFDRALRAAPEVERLWGAKADFLKSSGKTDDAERALERGSQVVGHPLLRMRLTIAEMFVRLARGDTASALALRRSIRAASERDGRAGIRAEYDYQPCSRRVWGEVNEDQDARQRRIVERPRAAGDWAWVERTLIGCGRELMDRGELTQALRHFTRALALADSARLPGLYLEILDQRGRAYSKLGRLGEAERDLRRALSLGAGAGWLYTVADAHHNLAHVFEGAGRWTEASREIDRFVVLTRPMQGGLHFTSLLDAGEIRWKAGWHASARAAFEEMVRVTDEQGAEHYWAGEYYERIGDLRRARTYYVKARSESGWNSRAQGALAHVYEQLGQLDSAESVARIHDAQEALWPPLEVPLMPAIHSRRGRSTEAVRLARAWADRQERRGNVQGASRAFLHLARLALDARSTRVALSAAEHAESLATTLHLATERIQAVVVRGRALRQLGLRDSAVTALREAARLARVAATTDNVFETSLALGAALAEQGHTDAALAAYERAARVTEYVTQSFSIDLDRAQYRDRHLRPFDGAVQALVGRATSARRIQQLVMWSARRKAAALALSVHEASGRTGTTGHRPSLSGLQARLGEHDAMLDYVVLDSVVAVIAIARGSASLVRLPISADTLRAWVGRLRQPLVAINGGRLDLARAPFSLHTAARLHAALVRPLASVLAGKRRLIVVPDGPLHALPFEALVVSADTDQATAPDYTGAEYLMDAYEVAYLPSSSFLTQSDAKRAESLSGSRLLVVSYGAPGAEREAEALRVEWPAGSTTLLAGTAATEHAAKAAMARYDVIHFAVHAQASARDPLASHLRLAPDAVEDSYLHLDEIAAGKVGARLVVLSACETDAGPIYNGEGVMGLARAFLASGTRNVVGTLWPVGPTTAELMKEFYRRLAIGEAPAAALRGAKIAMRSARVTAHPFYWRGRCWWKGVDGKR